MDFRNDFSDKCFFFVALHHEYNTFQVITIKTLLIFLPRKPYKYNTTHLHL